MGTVTGMTGQDTKRCDNLACICETPLAQSACAPYCDSTEGRDAHNVRCECGHGKCEEQAERQLSGEPGRESPA